MMKSIRNLIIENIYKIKNENREIEEIVFSEEAYRSLATEWDLPSDHKFAIKELFGYPIKILSYLPSDYIGLRIKNGIRRLRKT